MKSPFGIAGNISKNQIRKHDPNLKIQNDIIVTIKINSIKILI
jgi:hypothetical protein